MNAPQPLNPGSALPILGAPDPRLAKLQRMRDKLAGNSEKEALLQERREREQTQIAWSRGWRVLALLAIIGLSWLAFGLRDEWSFKSKTKSIPVLSAPKNAAMNADQELLFWTYALYDVGRLRREFNPPAKMAVDGNLARARIRELLPKAGAKAAFIAQMYRTNRGKIR